jgi:hypothetical protein
MKVNFQTDRLLQLKQSKWLPWYWQLLLWPTVFFLLLMTFAAQESKLTCRKSEGKCQLESQTLAAKEVKTISIDNIEKIDLVATDDADTTSLAQLVLLGKDGSKVNVGSSASFETVDGMAAKLSWFLESSTAQYFELSDSNIWITRFLGLTGGASIFWFFWRGGERVATFDRERQLLTVEQRQLFRNKAQDYPLSSIESVEVLNSSKPTGQNIALQRQEGNVTLNDKILPLFNQQKNQQVAAQVRSFLNLQAPTPPPAQLIAYPQPMGDWDGQKTSFHEVVGDDGAKYEMEVFLLYRDANQPVANPNTPTSHELYPLLQEVWSRHESYIQEDANENGGTDKLECYLLYRYFLPQDRQA